MRAMKLMAVAVALYGGQAVAKDTTKLVKGALAEQPTAGRSAFAQKAEDTLQSPAPAYERASGLGAAMAKQARARGVDPMADKDKHQEHEKHGPAKKSAPGELSMLGLDRERVHLTPQQTQELQSDPRDDAAARPSNASATQPATGASHEAARVPVGVQGEARPEGTERGSGREVGVRSGATQHVERAFHEPTEREAHVPSMHFERPERFKPTQSFFR